MQRPRSEPGKTSGGDASISRRELVRNLGGGLGLLGLAATLRTRDVQAAEGPETAPRARRVIQLFMNGGPYTGDLFDPKPLLARYAGERPKEVELRTERPTGGLLPSPFRFAPHGRSGLLVSELLPRLSEHADKLCVLRAVHTDNPNHGPALLLMNNGTISPTRPSLGAWLSYGLGTENDDLPAYVVLCPGRPVRFSILWTNGFLPGEHQGTYINHSNLEPERMIPWLHRGDIPRGVQRQQLDLLERIDRGHAATRGNDPVLEARIRAMETAYRMQTAATDAFDVESEPAAVREAYGRSHFANGCVLARRLAERGVRFVQVYYGNGQPWDTHGRHNELMRGLANDIDRPIAALLADLEQRGLLDDTLVVWGGEFGRTPTSENGDGRDHNHYGFTVWLAGGGVRGGIAHGATDEFGFRAAVDRVHIHDLHATILHLLGIDHERLTFRYAGRDFRLTDVAGEVVKAVIA